MVAGNIKYWSARNTKLFLYCSAIQARTKLNTDTEILEMTDRISKNLDASQATASAAESTPAKKPTRRTKAAKAAPKSKPAAKRKARAKSAKTVAKPQTEQTNLPAEGLNGPDPELMKKQSGLWNTLMDRYFRLDISGWENLPDQPSLLIGVHSGGPLTMDAWTVVMAWWRQFGKQRSLHGTAHDVLMNSPLLGEYFRRLGTISPSRENILAAFEKGDDVILWPGGEVDAYRTWKKRDTAVLGGRKGFVRLAIRSGVPIVPVATIGGHDTLFVLSEGRGLAKMLKLKERMRSDVAPITLSWPFGVTLHLTPFQHVPLPAKIRTQFLEPIDPGNDPALADDQEYVDSLYDLVEGRIQEAMTAMAKKRKFPIFA
jgi:1-acyl-sn-glycerol-3-phosphate acyltransferase